MSTIKKILVPFSSYAELNGLWPGAQALARSHNAELILCRCTVAGALTTADPERLFSEMKAIQTKLEQSGLRFRLMFAGDADIPTYASQNAIDLIWPARARGGESAETGRMARAQRRIPAGSPA